MFIRHNMPAVIAQGELNINSAETAKRAERLSTGYRINRAADDAAGLTISEKLRWQVRGLNRASDNIQDGISLLQVADGALEEVHSMLHRMSELSIQAANDVNTHEDRSAIQAEIDTIKEEINAISANTTFNTMRLFKPTNVPEMKGRPVDMLVYHEDYAGGVREGGIIYNGLRYSYDKDVNVKMDPSGNILPGEYKFTAKDENGDDIDVILLFDGGSRIPSGRKYEMNVEKDGIYIDNLKHDWPEVRSSDGMAFDPDNIKPGTYTFNHAGLDISFTVEEEMDFLSFKDEMKQEGFKAYELLSTDMRRENVKINPTIDMTDVSPIDSSKQDFIPCSRSSNYINAPDAYRMHADNSGIYMYLDASDSPDGTEKKFDFMTWEDLRLNEWTETDLDRNGSVNAANGQVEGEKHTQYQYHDSITGATIGFTIDSEVSKGELMQAINDWQIDVRTNTEMKFTASSSGSGTTISMGSHSPSLDAYGTHYDMGRIMPNQVTLQSGMQLRSDGSALKFDMTDANGKTYTFSADNVANNVKSKVDSDMNSYISSYRSALVNKLNDSQGASTSVSVSGKDSNSVIFRDNANGHSFDLNFTEDFTGWLGSSDFDITYTTYTDTSFYPPQVRRRYSATLKSAAQSRLDARRDTLAANVYNALASTSMTAKTDNNNPITAATTIGSPDATENIRYSSSVDSGELEIKIQSGALEKQSIGIELPPMNNHILKIGGVDVMSFDSATSAITSIGEAVQKISEMRSGYGATQNRLEYAMRIDDISAENSQRAESYIRDADMADEMVEYSKSSILAQAGQAILSQTNRGLESVLQLLE